MTLTRDWRGSVVQKIVFVLCFSPVGSLLVPFGPLLAHVSSMSRFVADADTSWGQNLASLVHTFLSKKSIENS